jgi:hypothetical protein
VLAAAGALELVELLPLPLVLLLPLPVALPVALPLVLLLLPVAVALPLVALLSEPAVAFVDAAAASDVAGASAGLFFLFEPPEYRSEYQPLPFRMKLADVICRLARGCAHDGQSLSGSSDMR